MVGNYILHSLQTAPFLKVKSRTFIHLHAVQVCNRSLLGEGLRAAPGAEHRGSTEQFDRRSPIPPPKLLVHLHNSVFWPTGFTPAANFDPVPPRCSFPCPSGDPQISSPENVASRTKLARMLSLNDGPGFGAVLHLPAAGSNRSSSNNVFPESKLHCLFHRQVRGRCSRSARTALHPCPDAVR